MPGLAEMLRDGPGPGGAGPGGPPPGGPDMDDPAAGKMSPDQAVQIMQQFKIPPDPKVVEALAAACDVLLPLMQQGGEGSPPDDAGPPPGPGGPPPGA